MIQVRQLTAATFALSTLLLTGCNDYSVSDVGTKDGGGSGALVAQCAFTTPGSNLSTASLVLTVAESEGLPSPSGLIQAGIYLPDGNGGSSILLLQRVAQTPPTSGVLARFTSVGQEPSFEMVIENGSADQGFDGTLSHAVLSDGTAVDSVSLKCSQVNVGG